MTQYDYNVHKIHSTAATIEAGGIDDTMTGFATDTLQNIVRAGASYYRMAGIDAANTFTALNKFNANVELTAGSDLIGSTTSDINFGSGALFWDSANSRLGIGDSTPGYKLDVNGTGRFVGAVTLDSTLSVKRDITILESTPTLILRDSDSTGISQTGWISLQDSTSTEKGYMGFGATSSSNLTIQNSYAADVRIRTNGIDALTITSAGHSGFGETNPQTRIHLTDNPVHITMEDSGGSVDDKVLQMKVDSGRFTFDSLNDDYTSRLSSIISLDLGTGNIGINDISPSYKLDVDGTMRVTGSVTLDSALNVTGNITLGTGTSIVSVTGGDTAPTALTRTMAGIELTRKGMNLTSKYGRPLKFMSSDPNFTTENPKFLASIIPRATESYDADTDGGTALDFFVTPNNPGANSLPVLALTIDQDKSSTFAGNLTIGDGSAGVDNTLTFNGETNDGILTWMEDEDLFKFSDDVLINSTEKLYLNSTTAGGWIQHDGSDLTIKNDVSGGSDNIILNCECGNIIFQEQGTDKLKYTSSGDWTFTPEVVFSKGIVLPLRTSTDSSNTINDLDEGTLLVDATSSNATVFMGINSQSTGHPVTIKKIDSTANTVIISCNSSKTIDGVTTHTLSSQWDVVTIQYDGTNWVII